MPNGSDLILGIDAGTSVIKAVAFTLSGRQVAAASVPNRYDAGPGGAVTQPLDRTWEDCARALRDLGERVENLAERTAALAVTGQGDGTWLVGADDRPVADAWLWLDARAAPTVRRLAAGAGERARFEATGTGLNTCQQGSQLAHMAATAPDLLGRAEAALHCKDWLYLNLTGVRATDPSEASFTFGDFRSRTYSDAAINALGLGTWRRLLPPILDGTEVTHPLTAEAAKQTGLRAGTPVSLGYVDMVMTALGAGVHTGEPGVACSTVGSTGVHMRAVRSEDFHLNDEGTGYAILLPVPGMVTQVQTNMAATLNLDWALSLARDVLADWGIEATPADLVGRVEGWLACSAPAQLLFHPYISEAGERGPFVDASARAGFNGLSQRHRFPDLLRAVVEGLGMAMRDCYAAMGPLPSELRLTGGAARSRSLRGVLAAATGARVRVSSREEAGAAGAAMMAAVAIGAYPSMAACIDEWVVPLLGAPEAPDSSLVAAYDSLFPAYLAARRGLSPAWAALGQRSTGDAP
ncbi:Erythritol kinase EryA [Rubellimicrobium mesophilum DSM 19309]|uniref:Erythritol kinase EryA n=1 Tax=Rubellimicrobium mesophilum DSM 19309 TaxID=442562 RepID=A0A017HT24_9RHOB|nr:FGGY-family carbohydrate kinase [Rubellimicrobium mesophilum]EYD77516.1 Erythritol kinase EryA [Rubellimicrobium mesophilum DSM 19309]